MSGNSLGRLFRITTCGESHGPGLACIIDGCPPGLALTEADIQVELDRRRPGSSRFTTQRKETDTVKILSGTFEGKTTGTSIGLVIENCDQKSKDYSDIADKFRPGHADFTYQEKYGIRDYRGGGRSSARETANWVAAGAIAKKYLAANFNIIIRGCLLQVGQIKLELKDWQAVNNNPFFCPDDDKISELENYIQSIRKQGDSIGAKVFIEATGVMPGLGDPVFHKLDADLAHAMMGINGAKGVEIGAGFDAVTQKGSVHRDEMTQEGFLSNQSGGILGGISSGQAIQLQVAMKPASSIITPGKTVDTKGQPQEIITKGRHDPCIGIRAVPVAEAMLAIVLMDHLLCHRGQNSQ